MRVAVVHFNSVCTYCNTALEEFYTNDQLPELSSTVDFWEVDTFYAVCPNSLCKSIMEFTYGSGRLREPADYVSTCISPRRLKRFEKLIRLDSKDKKSKKAKRKSPKR